MSELENKQIFLVASENLEACAHFEAVIKAQFPNSTVFKAFDGLEALFKCENVPPHVVIMDAQLPKVSAMDLTEKLLLRKDRIAVIVFSPKEIPERFMDQVATGQVQFISGPAAVEVIGNHLTSAINWVAHVNRSSYQIRFLNAGEQLLRSGEPGSSVFLVKSGELKASRNQDGQELMLGAIKAGEFVGEMAYINGEARSADVIALTDCELIEIPSTSLDSVLYSKPAWSKALMKTLSKRLKLSNESKT